jgi:hypothetical protein
LLPCKNKKYESEESMKRKSIIKMVVMAALVVFVSGVALAQQGDEPADNMQLLKEKIQSDKKFVIASNMNLTKNEAKLFWPVYDKYQKDLDALKERSIKNVGNYADNADKMTDKIAKKVVTDYISIEADRQKLRQSYLPKFAKVLPYKKVMRYYQLENKISAIVNYEIARRIPLVE